MRLTYFHFLAYSGLLGTTTAQPPSSSLQSYRTHAIRCAEHSSSTSSVSTTSTAPDASGTSTAASTEGVKSSTTKSLRTSRSSPYRSSPSGTRLFSSLTAMPPIPIGSSSSTSSSGHPTLGSPVGSGHLPSSNLGTTSSTVNPEPKNSGLNPIPHTSPLPTHTGSGGQLPGNGSPDGGSNGNPKTAGVAAVKALIPQLAIAGSLLDHLVSSVKTLASAAEPLENASSGISASGVRGLVDNIFDSLFGTASHIAGGTGFGLSSALESIELDTLNLDPALQKQVTKVVKNLLDIKDILSKATAVLKPKITVTNAKKLSTLVVGGIAEYEGIKILAAWAFAEEKSTSVSRPAATGTISSTSSTPTETLIRYAIFTKRGTSIDAFHAFIKTLPDKGEGAQVVYPNIDTQGYGTYLKPSEVNAISDNPIVMGICEDAIPENQEFMASVIPPKRKRNPLGNLGKKNLSKAPNSPDHLRLLSQNPNNALARRNAKNPSKAPEIPDYILDPIAGEGTTIFVIDTGINPAQKEFETSVTRSPSPGWYIVPSRLTGPFRPDNPAMPHQFTEPDPDDKMIDNYNHGTCVSSMAAGLRSGVAKKATLVPVKYKNKKSSAQTLAIADAWGWIISTVKARNSGPNPPQPGWAVINFSHGYKLTNDPKPNEKADFQIRTNLLVDLLQQCRENDITVVISATNYENIHDMIPQNLAGDAGERNGIVAITVGGVDSVGSYWDGTSTFTPGQPGNIDVYAMAENVHCASNDDINGFQVSSGTSLAAPQVAGLAAYYLSLPVSENEGAPNLHRSGLVAQAVKDYIKGTSYARISGTNNQPGKYNVAYNNAEKGVCGEIDRGPPLKRRQLDPKLVVRDANVGLVPVVVNGKVVDPEYSPCVLSMTSSVSTTAVVSTSHTPAPTRTTVLTSSHTSKPISTPAPSKTSLSTKSPLPLSAWTKGPQQLSEPAPQATHGPDPQCADSPLVQCAPPPPASPDPEPLCVDGPSGSICTGPLK